MAPDTAEIERIRDGAVHSEYETHAILRDGSAHASRSARFRAMAMPRRCTPAARPSENHTYGTSHSLLEHTHASRPSRK